MHREFSGSLGDQRLFSINKKTNTHTNIVTQPHEAGRAGILPLMKKGRQSDSPSQDWRAVSNPELVKKVLYLSLAP